MERWKGVVCVFVCVCVCVRDELAGGRAMFRTVSG